MAPIHAASRLGDSLSRFQLIEISHISFTAGDDGSCYMYFYRTDGKRNVLFLNKDGSVLAGWREAWT